VLTNTLLYAEDILFCNSFLALSWRTPITRIVQFTLIYMTMREDKLKKLLSIVIENYIDK